MKIGYVFFFKISSHCKLCPLKGLAKMFYISFFTLSLYVTVKLRYNGLLGTVHNRPLYPSLMYLTSHQIHGHDVHALFVAIFDDSHSFMKVDAIRLAGTWVFGNNIV